MCITNITTWAEVKVLARAAVLASQKHLQLYFFVQICSRACVLQCSLRFCYNDIEYTCQLGSRWRFCKVGWLLELGSFGCHRVSCPSIISCVIVIEKSRKALCLVYLGCTCNVVAHMLRHRCRAKPPRSRYDTGCFCLLGGS